MKFIIRIILMTALLYFVFQETGWATMLLGAFLFIISEAQAALWQHQGRLNMDVAVLAKALADDMKVRDDD